MRAGAGNRPVVVDEAQVGAGAPAPIGLTGVGSWEGRGKQEHPVTLPALLTWPSPSPLPFLSQHRCCQTRLCQQAGSPPPPQHRPLLSWKLLQRLLAPFWSLTHGLPGGVIHLQVEGLGIGPLYHGDIVAGPLVGLGQRVCPPVRPVHLATIQCHCKRVRQELVSPKHLHVTGAVVTG